ncbi:helix-turn-helix transcriptional regulator [Brachybacterium squillarum]|uniref:helix-turn-helix transcriptional regulator n=1 Tax=Brachybacterium squillarum TaxID=661979 RepID=UPI0022227E17|nr:helix-turn-helix transcriptional regulator [Brachybacterium squillarum]MCW1804582.1 helix-turn-helix transcriptional regulator [Brachybacterium squillarum]
MSLQSDVRDFLTSRRARLTPDRAGLPAYGGHRRVPGLRREEVAMLAGMSVDYYIRLERGNLSGASGSVLEALARALQLDEAEHDHLLDLARRADAGTRPPRSTSSARCVPAVVQQVLDAIADAPAWVRNARHDVLAANALGHALYAPLMESPVRPLNTARFLFLDPASRTFFRDWERSADDVTGMLRIEAGRHPGDRDLSDLIGELSTRSTEFSVRWARHDVRFHRAGSKRLHHPVVGDLDLDYLAMDLAEQDDLRLLVYTAAPGSPSADGLRMLAAWAARGPETAGGPTAGAQASGPSGASGITMSK